MENINGLLTDAEATLGAKIALSIGMLLIFLSLRFIVGKIISRASNRFSYQEARANVIRKVANSMTFVIICLILLGIWGVERKELTLFISSTLTVLAIGFFAQWSILSNITSSIIIFFNHPIMIGDTITILDKDFPVEGNIVDIGAFFITIKSTSGEYVSTPSSVFMQKMIKRDSHK